MPTCTTTARAAAQPAHHEPAEPTVQGQPVQEVDPHGGIDLGNTDRIGVSAWTKRPPTTPAASLL